METILKTMQPIVQKLVEDELKTVIEQNIDKIDTIEPMVDAKLGEVAGKIKALIIDNINKIPLVPDSMKQGLISQIPVVELIKIVNEFDFEPFKATLLAIPTTGISDPTELNKIKTTLTGLPDKIKSLLIKHIESVFNGTAAASEAEEKTAATTTSATTTDAAATTTAAEIQTISIKDAVTDMTDKEKKNTQDVSLKAIIDSGIFTNIDELIAAANGYKKAAGGAKKRRRKTKKNIRRNKNAKTRFGRTF